ncbi:hypothetical protein BD779DRAFT_1529546 [Infundibulicybe gibba]|nr:hypothetical protein BD779DRAFT_1529546 [Infundibulicybe gibba]
MKARLQSLKRLDLSFGYITGTVNFCEVAPRLTEVKLMGIYRPVTISLPWEQLRVCTLDDTEVAFYVLQHAKNLWRLHLDLSNLSEGPPRPGGLMTLSPNPFTRHLGLNVLIMEWSFMDHWELNFFFFSVTLPALRILKVRFDYPYSTDIDERASIADDRDELDDTLRKFFQQSCAHLETLELIDIPFSQFALIRHLKYSPSLSSLDIRFDSRWYTIDKTLLCELDVNRPWHLLPRLRSLSLRGLVNIVSIGEPLGALIASRRHINPEHHEVALLENLTLECDFLQPESEYPQFQQFVSEGLNITYETGVGT